MHTTKWRTSYSEQDKRDIYYFKTFANLHHYYHLSSTSIPLTYGKIVRWWPMKEGGRRKEEGGRRKKEEEGGKRRKRKRKGGRGMLHLAFIYTGTKASHTIIHRII